MDTCLAPCLLICREHVLVVSPRSYLQYEPDGIEDYIDFLLSIDRVGEAAKKLAEMLNRENIVSTKGKSRHTLWMELCELVCKNPRHVKALRVEPILLSGLRSFSDEAGHLWCALADFFIRQALFEQARGVYEEAIASALTVRDFSMIFDAYSQACASRPSQASTHPRAHPRAPSRPPREYFALGPTV